jgi:hypothetical protein
MSAGKHATSVAVGTSTLKAAAAKAQNLNQQQQR